MTARPKRPSAHARTPDSRYFVVRGRLWRCSNPALSDGQRVTTVTELMAARRAVKDAKRANDAVALAKARLSVDAAKHTLGERGPVWWHDGAPDYMFERHRNAFAHSQLV